MSWIFRWLEHLLARLPRSRGDGDGWVEPSNAITRAILAGSVGQLPAAASTATIVDVEVAAPAEVAAEAPVAPETRTERKTRRRRSARAA